MSAKEFKKRGFKFFKLLVIIIVTFLQYYVSKNQTPRQEADYGVSDCTELFLFSNEKQIEA